MTLSERLFYATLLAIAVLAIPIIADAAPARDIERIELSGSPPAPEIKKQEDA